MSEADLSSPTSGGGADLYLAEEDGVAVFEQVAAQAAEHQRAMEGLQVRERPHFFSATVVAFVLFVRLQFPYIIFLAPFQSIQIRVRGWCLACRTRRRGIVKLSKGRRHGC